MKRFVIIFALILASCTPNYDDIGSSPTYFIKVTAEVEKATYQIDDVYLSSPRDVEKYVEYIYSNPEASIFEKKKIEDSYKNGHTLTMDEPLADGLRFRRTNKTYYVEIRIN